LAFGLDALSFIVSAILVAGIPAVPRADAATGARRGSPVEDLLGGLRHLFGSRVLVGLFLTFAIAMLGLGAVNVLYLPFLLNELHGWRAGVGRAGGAQRLGLLVGGLAVSALAAGFPPVALVVFGICGLGCSFAGIGLLRWPALAVALLAVIGLF